jgi:hypothetical protein
MDNHSRAEASCPLSRALAPALVFGAALSLPVFSTASDLFQLDVSYGLDDSGAFALSESFNADNVEDFADIIGGDDLFLDRIDELGMGQPFESRLQYMGLSWEVNSLESDNPDSSQQTGIEFVFYCDSRNTPQTTVRFTAGASQEANLEALVDYLEDDATADGGITVDDLGIGACLVSGSPIDPVAGNPNSLLATMAQQDFMLGATEDLDRMAKFGIGLGAATVDADNFDSWSATLPINYIHSIPRSGGRPMLLIFDAPLRYVDLEGASVVDGSLGFGLRYPVLDNWALTPMLRAGLTASRDTGSLQAAYSASVTSHLEFYVLDRSLTLSLNNSVGVYRTDSIDAGDFEMEYDTDNTIWRNGLAASGRLPWVWLDQPTSWEVQFVDTRISGDDWYYDSYDEVVVSMGTKAMPDRARWQDLRLGLKYTFASDYDSLQLVLNYRF